MLGTLTDTVTKILHESKATVEVVSVSGDEFQGYSVLELNKDTKESKSRPEVRKNKSMNEEIIMSTGRKSMNFQSSNFNAHPGTDSFYRKSAIQTSIKGSTSIPAEDLSTEAASACVWLSARLPEGSFMSAVKLQGFLELKIYEVKNDNCETWNLFYFMIYIIMI